MDKSKIAYSSEKVVKYYDRNDMLQKAESTILALLKKKLTSMQMLDIGVGGGRTTKHFAPLVKEYTGVDYSEAMINLCKSKFKEFHFFAADARNLSIFPANSFDFILFSFNGIDYMGHDDRIRCLSEIKRLLKKDGYFCFSSHNILSIQQWKSIKFSINPQALFQNTVLYFKRKKVNRMNSSTLREITRNDFAIVNDGAHDWQLRTYYVNPKSEIIRLENIGFRDIRLFDLKDGNELSKQEIEHAVDKWLYYLCK